MSLFAKFYTSIFCQSEGGPLFLFLLPPLVGCGLCAKLAPLAFVFVYFCVCVFVYLCVCVCVSGWLVVVGCVPN